MSKPLDRWVSANIRMEIEQRFYAKVSERASFDSLAHDPVFMSAPAQHVGLFADHGPVHARDVANQIITVLDTCHEKLIPLRSEQRFALMQGYGVLLAYFHDIGMIDFSSFGRTMHPEYAAQAVFDPDLDDLIEMIWRENSGGLAWQLRTLADNGHFIQVPIMVLREMLSLSICHSKSKIPVAYLNDTVLLRQKMIDTIPADLDSLYLEQQSKQKTKRQPNPKIDRYAHLFPDKAFCWLVDDDPILQALVEDVIDTLRALRAADALRQRGTTLATSGGYQVFVDQGSGSAIYALRLGEDKFFPLEMPEPISAGEANIASSELDSSGDLRISFHHGAFTDPGATEHAAYSAAVVVNDIQKDVIESFKRPAVDPGFKPAADIRIFLEETEDNSSFPQLVQRKLSQINPEAAERIKFTPSLKNVHPLERDRYLASPPLTWNRHMRLDFLAHISRSGHPVERIDIEQAFDDVRLAKLNAGEVLIEANAPSSFVYFPLGPGLKIIPLGRYESFLVQPWMAIGMTGVVRAAERSATIVAERRLQVLIIPKMAYLKHWHHTLSLDALQKAVSEATADNGAAAGDLTQLEKSVMLQEITLFNKLDQHTLMELAARFTEVHIAAEERLFVKGSIGRSLFVVVTGSLLVHDEALLLAQLGPGDVVGELAAITPEPRMATVTASADSSLLRLDQRDLNELIDSNAAVARAVIDVLAGYLRERTAVLKEQNQEDR